MAEEKGLDVVGIFHSHPKSLPSPSNTDIKFMKGNPIPWIIYSGINKGDEGVSSRFRNNSNPNKAKLNSIKSNFHTFVYFRKYSFVRIYYFAYNIYR